MATTRRRTRRPVGRRKTIWARASGVMVNTSLIFPLLQIPTQVDLLAPFEAAYGAQLLGCTISRIRGNLVNVQATNALLLQERVTFHVTDQNDTVRPLTGGDNAYDVAAGSLDYFGFYPLVAPLDSATTTALVPGTEPCSLMIDIRSSRKITELNQSLVMRLSTKAAQALQCSVAYDLSILVTLP